MQTLFLAVLAILDVALLVAFFRLNRRQDDQVSLLSELTEERQLISSLRSQITHELNSAEGRNRAMMEKVAHLAMEAEEEVKSGGATLAKGLGEVVDQLSGKFEAPLQELARKQASLEALFRKIEQQKLSLKKMIERAETLTAFFDQRVSYEQILLDIEDKKYTDARQLLAKGHNPEKVAQELGIPPSEMRIIANLTT
jgi:hypothetical protein